MILHHLLIISVLDSKFGFTWCVAQWSYLTSLTNNNCSKNPQQLRFNVTILCDRTLSQKYS